MEHLKHKESWMARMVLLSAVALATLVFGACGADTLVTVVVTATPGPEPTPDMQTSVVAPAPEIVVVVATPTAGPTPTPRVVMVVVTATPEPITPKPDPWLDDGSNAGNVSGNAGGARDWLNRELRG